MIDSTELARLLKCAIIGNDKQMFKRDQRAAGVIEGLLLCSGMLPTGKDFDYKTIEIPNPNFFATSPTISRLETYNEHMMRLAEEAIETLTKGE